MSTHFLTSLLQISKSMMIPRLEAKIILNCREISPLGTAQLLKSFTQRNMIDLLITVQKHLLLKVLILQLDYSTVNINTELNIFKVLCIAGVVSLIVKYVYFI